MPHPGPSVTPVGFSNSNYRDHHNSSPNFPPLGHAWPHQPPSHMDEEASMSPPTHFNSPVKPSNISVKATDTLMASEFKKAKLEVTPPKKRAAGGNAGGPKGKAKAPGGPGGSEMGPGGLDPNNGTKRVYSCPHCQRSYDWNYNLNRHLKYECGKENAFQCAKCGRKFPHKQNCVYHLKRKHKIVCDTIDQYMNNGLVIFRGSSNAGGNLEANLRG